MGIGGCGDGEEIPGVSDGGGAGGTEKDGVPWAGGSYRQTHARILLLSDENQSESGMKDDEIARVLKVGSATVARVRRRCVEEGLERALGARSN